MRLGMQMPVVYVIKCDIRCRDNESTASEWCVLPCSLTVLKNNSTWKQRANKRRSRHEVARHIPTRPISYIGFWDFFDPFLIGRIEVDIEVALVSSVGTFLRLNFLSILQNTNTGTMWDQSNITHANTYRAISFFRDAILSLFDKSPLPVLSGYIEA